MQAPDSIEKVLVIRLNEAPAADAGKPKPGGGSLLEWTKAVLLPLVTLLITIVGGFYFTSLTKKSEAQQSAVARDIAERESNDRLFAQLLTQREQSDAQVRKDMFKTVIDNFFAGSQRGDWSDKILQLELLASNFNQSLDLAPLFKDLARRLMSDRTIADEQRKALRKRLDLTASNVIFKQVNSLARRGFGKEEFFSLRNWTERFGKPFIVEPKDKSHFDQLMKANPAMDPNIQFAVEVVDVNLDRREAEIRLRVTYTDPAKQDVDRHFWVGQYDFPMLDNTQLPEGLRVSVVITEFNVPDLDREANSWIKFHLIVFPAASASFKERQDYDDILIDKLSSEQRHSQPMPEEQ
jgi:hypothetical protein